MFEDYVKIFYNNKSNQLFDLRDLTIIDVKDQPENANILNYLKDISKYLNSSKVNESGKQTFLERQYNNLIVSKDSVLYSYLNKFPLNKIDVDLENLIFPFAYNNSQKDAIKTVLSKNIGIIEGPPGTGKTQTILNIIVNLAIMQNKTIAIVSNNNEAIKNIFDKMFKLGYSFFLANLGSKSKRENFFENLSNENANVFENNINIESLIEENNKLNKKMDYYLEKLKEKAIIEKKIDDYLLEQKYFEDTIKSENLDDINFDIELNSNKILNIIFSLQFLEDKLVLLKPFYMFLISHKYKLNKISKNSGKYMLRLQKEFYIVKIKDYEEKLKSINKELEQSNLEEIKKKQKEISMEIFHHRLYEKFKNVRKDFTFDNYLNIFDDFVKRFPVVLSTTHSLKKSIPENFLFDYLIIDESSQVDLVTGALVLSACKNAIIVGDEKQLPQIIDFKIKDNLFNFNVDEKYDYFKNNIMSSIRKIYKDSLPISTLIEHYRCHPKIIEFSNKQYYEGKLIAYANDDHLKVTKPLIIYFTQPGCHMRKRTEGNKGIYNERELKVIKDEVLTEVLLGKYDDKDVGITTPYRLQAEMMAQEKESIESDTVHKYQGREKKVMILSTVLDNSFYGFKSLSFVDDSHMVNVAISRAEECFVLVTHNKLFKENGKEINALIKYIQYQSMASEVLESNLISVFDLLYKEYSKKLDSLNKRLFTRLKYKSENIIDTILFDILNRKEFEDYIYTRQVFMKNVVKNTESFNSREINFINRASFDFVIYDKLNYQPVLVIEVDGFKFHENNLVQLNRDKIKNNICKKINLPLIRLKTNYTYSEEDIFDMIAEVLIKGYYPEKLAEFLVN